MPLSPYEAYKCKRAGKDVIVVCETCGDKVWTSDATYSFGGDEWHCDDCTDDMIDDIIDEMVEDP